MSLPIRISLPSNFLSSETRDGFVVSEKRKRIWAVELDLYSEFEKVCRKYGIDYQICYGTLLGAIRHKGFIPWDDDFDVWMSRESITKLHSLAHEFRYPYFLQTPLSDRQYFGPLTRLRNSETTAAIKGFDTPDYNNGIYIDIYALDGRPNTQFQSFVQYLLKRIVVKGITLKGQRGPRNSSLKEVILFILKPFSSIMSYEDWYSLYVNVLQMYNRNASKLVHGITTKARLSPCWINMVDIKDTITVPFEWFDVPAPRAYDSILRRMYGDYMKYPPDKERGEYHNGLVIFDPDIAYKDYIAASE